MHRMIFEDFKLLMPDAQIHFSCPKYYHDAVSDHPFIDKLLDCANIKERDFREDYIISYDTTTSCGRTEMKLAPSYGPHRSDIWANHCGVTLTKHDMHFRLTDHEIIHGYEIIEQQRDRQGSSVLISPISAMQNKNLLEHQLLKLVQGLRDRGLYPFVYHHEPVYMALKNDIPMVVEKNMRKWLGIVNQVDYVVSVDTATFHCAGGMKKPLVGIFTFVNGQTYAKHYPNVEIVQGPCPFGHCGCYNWGACPKLKEKPLLPCLTEITAEPLLTGVDNMLAKYPIKNSTKEERWLKSSDQQVSG